MYGLEPLQITASLVFGMILLAIIIRLIQKGTLDIAYCWLWLSLGIGIILVVLRYDLLDMVSTVMGSKTRTTTLFLLGFMVLLLMSLQFSIVISSHRRQIKKLSQQIALLGACNPGKTDSPREGGK